MPPFGGKTVSRGADVIDAPDPRRVLEAMRILKPATGPGWHRWLMRRTWNFRKRVKKADRPALAAGVIALAAHPTTVAPCRSHSKIQSKPGDRGGRFRCAIWRSAVAPSLRRLDDAGVHVTVEHRWPE